MERYRVLLVDDEEEIRQGISRKIDWEALGFQLVGEAENGAEALDLAVELQPDVVLTDIKMPFMDGLELCRHLGSQLPAAKLVVFSGFDDFEFARTAIGMHVSEYILKPINAPELNAVLTKLKGQLDEQRAERRDMDTLRRRYEESLPTLRELFFTRLLEGHIPADEIEERAARYEITLPQGTWMTALIRVEGEGDHALSGDELILLSVRAFVQERILLEEGRYHLFLFGDWVAVLASVDGESGVYPFIDEMGRICALAQSILGLTLTVGVGRPCQSTDSLRTGGEEARMALDYRVLTGAGRAIYIADLEPDGTTVLTFDEEDERTLSAAVKLGSPQQVTQVVEGLVERIRTAGVDLPQCQFFLLEMVTGLVKLARSGGIEPEMIFGRGFAGAVRIADFTSREAMGSWYLTRCLGLQEMLSRQRTDSAGRTVERAKRYIGEHYEDTNLNVDTLCAHLYLSPTYFSTLFKRETGMNFTAYVTGVRMTAAAAMLAGSDEKTYLIAQKTGYTDANYFSYVFKRQFGVSPSKYRANLQG